MARLTIIFFMSLGLLSVAHSKNPLAAKTRSLQSDRLRVELNELKDEVENRAIKKFSVSSAIISRISDIENSLRRHQGIKKLALTEGQNNK